MSSLLDFGPPCEVVVSFAAYLSFEQRIHIFTMASLRADSADLATLVSFTVAVAPMPSGCSARKDNVDGETGPQWNVHNQNSPGRATGVWLGANCSTRFSIHLVRSFDLLLSRLLGQPGNAVLGISWRWFRSQK